MRLPAITLAITSCLFGTSLAEQEKTAAIDLEARKRSIPILEAHLQDREERMSEIAADIIKLDKRLEDKVDKIVTKLASIKDSEESGYRVNQIKKDAMQGLERSIATYQSKRATAITQAREGQTDIPAEVLEGDAAKFDERIEKRVQQILELSKSFTQDADVEKYQQVAGSGSGYKRWGSGFGGWGRDRDDELYEISDEWRQNRRDRNMDKTQQREILEALNKSIARHESLSAGLKDTLSKKNLSKTDRALMTSELERHETLLKARQEQLRELSEVAQPATAEVDRDEAHYLQEALADATGDLRRDFETIFVKYGELNREREKVFNLKKNLAARKKWLEENAK